MDKRYQVFISSTFTDLKEERRTVLRSVLMLDHMPAGMELFPATDDAAWQLICDVIDASDYYLLILGGRYGSLDEEGIGFTEKEYLYASSKGIPVVPFLHRNPDNIPRDKTETSPKAWKKLQSFRTKIENKHTCSYWESPEELQSQVILGLTATVKRNPRQGWIRAGKLASEEATQQIIKLQKLVEKQRNQLDEITTSAPEGIENLSQGDDEIEVEFKVSYTLEYVEYRHPERTVRERFKANVSWKELFGAIAPNLTEPQKDTKVRTDIARYLRERHDQEICEKHPDYKANTASIGESLFQTIRIQFSALGLIESKLGVIKLENGAEKQVRHIELTPYGRSQLVRIRAIYRDQVEAQGRRVR